MSSYIRIGFFSLSLFPLLEHPDHGVLGISQLRDCKAESSYFRRDIYVLDHHYAWYTYIHTYSFYIKRTGPNTTVLFEGILRRRIIYVTGSSDSAWQRNSRASLVVFFSFATSYFNLNLDWWAGLAWLGLAPVTRDRLNNFVHILYVIIIIPALGRYQLNKNRVKL